MQRNTAHPLEERGVKHGSRGGGATCDDAAMSAWLRAVGLACALATASGCGSSSSGGSPEGGAGAAGAGAAGDAGSGGSGAIGGNAGSGGASASGGASGASGAAGSGGTAAAPAVRLVGRFTKDAAPRFAWSGSEIQARFIGASVTLKLDDPSSTGNDFQVEIDGQVNKLHTSAAASSYALASNLGAGAHLISVYRRTEAFEGETTFQGFDFGAGGSLLAPPAAPDRRLEVIGDSITAGYGVEGADQYCSFSADTESHEKTYEAVAAKALGADLVTIAWSGIGMYRDYGGDTSNNMPARYDLTLPLAVGSTWDFSRFVPAAVVVNLGTNDFAQGDPGQAFVTAYLAFVQHLRDKYPAARIYCALGPMLDGSSLDSARADLKQVVSQRTQQGDQNIALLEFTTQTSADGYGCDWHPSATTHKKMAQVLEAALSADLGWN